MTFRFGLALLLTMGLSNPAMAIIINDTAAGQYDGAFVGDIDTFLTVDTTLSNSNPASEGAFVAAYLTSQGIDTTSLSFVLRNDPAPIFDTDAANVLAANIATDPAGIADFFVVKNTKAWALFDNSHLKDWAVFDVTDIPIDMNIGNDLTVSHITAFTAGGETVPEPSVLALMSLGLLGMGLTRFRRPAS